MQGLLNQYEKPLLAKTNVILKRKITYKVHVFVNVDHVPPMFVPNLMLFKKIRSLES